MKNHILKLLVILTCGSGVSQKKAPSIAQPSAVSYDQSLYSGIRWRELGPFRGGRSCTATGIPANPNVYYFGGVVELESNQNT